MRIRMGLVGWMLFGIPYLMAFIAVTVVRGLLMVAGTLMKAISGSSRKQQIREKARRDRLAASRPVSYTMAEAVAAGMRQWRFDGQNWHAYDPTTGRPLDPPPGVVWAYRNDNRF